MASLFKHKRTTLERIEKFISSNEWTDCNLLSRLYPEIHVLEGIYHFSCHDPSIPYPLSTNYKRITWKEAVKHEFKQTAVGKAFGPTWSTHWFRIEYKIPKHWKGNEIHLLWNSDSEALVWNEHGVPLQGLAAEKKRINFRLCKDDNDFNEKGIIYIEMACNGLFGAGKDSMIGPPNLNKYFILSKVELAIFNRQVFNLIQCFQCLADMARHLPESNPQSSQAMFTANEMINEIITGNKDSYSKAEQLAKDFFSQHNGSAQHVILAVGNCHIDTAWLWPYAETVRKCARSWSSTIQLMEEYPMFTFACSQAQQLQWVKETYPELWDKILYFSKRGQFLPVGGTWVEMDGNIPSGESFVRQFLYGQKFFEENFGFKCSEFWLPDTFGYSAQLPQIMKHCGIERFLTQKLSWNLVNTFPHNNFLWEGIDGSSVLTHFPPGNSYDMEVKVHEMIKIVENLKDKGRVSQSLMLFGHGDGGGGPTEEMIVRGIQLKDVFGLPKIEFSSPSDFFSRLETEVSKLCRWRGELYLELHNGTYTTHGDIKTFNRKCEVGLHDVELFGSIIYSYTKNLEDYPQNKLNISWQKLLLNQFHDVLPGTSINAVYHDSLNHYNEIITNISTLKSDALLKLCGLSETSKAIALNSLSWSRKEVIQIDNHKSLIVSIPPVGYSQLIPFECERVRLETTEDGCYILENFHLKSKIDSCGHILSMILKGCNKDIIYSGCFGNQLVLFDDVPLYWDAWDVMDYHWETRQPQNEVIEAIHVKSSSSHKIVLQATLKVGSESSAKLILTLDACKPYLLYELTVDWKEAHKFLKVEFPANVITNYATYEIQFGHLRRPTHQNTSWDAAQFEVCGHKWADLSEYDFGIAVLNDCKYGYSVRENVLSLSLLRSSKCPDENADMGLHTIRYAFMPHQKTFQEAGVIQRAYELNYPILFHQWDTTRANYIPRKDLFSWFELSVPNVILETIKKAESTDKALVLRLYEAYGSHVTTTLISKLGIANYQLCNGLEVPQTKFLPWDVDGVTLSFSPFHITTLLLHLL